MTRSRLILLGALLALIDPVFARVHRVPEDEPIAKIDIPGTWKTDEHEEFIEATSPDGKAHVLVRPSEGNKVNESMGETMRHVRAKGAINFDSSSLKHGTATVSGTKVQTVSWDGKDKAGAMRITFTIIPISGEPPLVFACWIPTQDEHKYRPAVDKMLASVKKMGANRDR